MMAAALSGLGVFAVASLAGAQGIFGGLIFGALASGAHLAAFGIDPMQNKGMEGVNEFENERVARAIDKAEGVLSDLLSAARRIGDRGLTARVERLGDSAREVLRTVERDPRDLPRARKFLTVYLAGARDATIKFADLYSRNQDASVRTDYEALLTDLETSFEKQREDLLLEDRSDLDVEIEVLRERLKREGLSA